MPIEYQSLIEYSPLVVALALWVLSRAGSSTGRSLRLDRATRKRNTR